ncbi:hypothetical protein AVEN_72916-1 [Araneus ventricosus]|uniref:Uncharacterized protein n=1 Tax=Araneus ventricosus TaxID=182803 RepID=A0A4Y2GZ22_ARAVE|nr:hypothetical protein AVEN_72916-1 [Araneus ventricosus]
MGEWSLKGPLGVVSKDLEGKEHTIITSSKKKRGRRNRTLYRIDSVGSPTLQVLATFLKPRGALRNLISNSSNEGELNETTRTIQLEIHKTCKQVYKIKHNTLIPNVTWWNRDLQRKKKELKALTRRLQKSRGEDRIHYKIVLSEKRAVFKKGVKRAQRGSWRLLCTQTQTPYGTPYRSALKAYKPPSDIVQIIEKQRERNSHRIRAKILQKLHQEQHRYNHIKPFSKKKSSLNKK